MRREIPAGLVCDLEAGGQGMLPRRFGTEMPRPDTAVEARVGDLGMQSFIDPKFVGVRPNLTCGCAWLATAHGTIDI